MTTINDLARPLVTLDPDAAAGADLDLVREVVGDARVVCIGESAHCGSEFYRLKDRVTRMLVQNLGFTAFVLESGFAEGLAVNEWIHGGPGELEDVARDGITYRFGECPEMHAQLSWMRDWNRSTPQTVQFYGMDWPGACVSPGAAVRACLARLEPRPGDAELVELTELGSRAVAQIRGRNLSPDARAELRNRLAGLVSRATESGDEIAIRCASPLPELVERMAPADPGATASGARDLFMADTVRWLLEREQRIIVSAHNAHIHRSAMPTGAAAFGKVLGAELGSDLVVIGTTQGSGETFSFTPRGEEIFDSEVSLVPFEAPPNSLDAVMRVPGVPLHLTDLRQVPAELLADATGSMVFDQVWPVEDLPHAFDAVVHFEGVNIIHSSYEQFRDDMAETSRLAAAAPVT
ncbi:erythromycin esterase family protein [Amycolatopsis thailandensis]|uniref:erythromycin esterase family protein n=1 Tax=Amycolatopsis thailandensis TaxID=589330 RepID=UPI00362FAC1F